MASLIEQGAYFTLLPREYYLSPEIYELETERIFRRQWTYAAHTSEIPDEGDYVVVELAGEGIVLIRGGNGEVSALLNVCRHRGHPVCEPPHGHARRLICPYHHWSYGLDGRLLNAPSMADGELFDYGDWGLKAVKVDVWHGLIFVSLSDEPRAPVSEALDEVASALVAFEPERTKKVYETTFDINANWKTLLENFQECYHCKGSHPELCVAMDLEQTYALNRSERPAGEYYGGGSPPKPGMKTISIDGELKARPLLGEYGRGAAVPDALHAGFGIQPMLSRALFNADHGTIHTLRPIDPTHVRWISRWFVHEDAVEGTDYDLDELTAVWRATNQQDLGLVGNAFRGVTSRGFVPGPLSVDREPALHSTLSVYLELLDRPA